MSKTTTLAAPLPLAVMKQSSTFSSSSMPSSSNTALQAAKKGQDGATEKTKKNKPIFNGSTIVGLACAFAVFDYVYLHLIFNRL